MTTIQESLEQQLATMREDEDTLHALVQIRHWASTHAASRRDASTTRLFTLHCAVEKWYREIAEDYASDYAQRLRAFNESTPQHRP